MSVELEKLLTHSHDPCERVSNVYLNTSISCPEGSTSCSSCIWEKRSDIHSKSIKLIDILEIEPDG